MYVVSRLVKDRLIGEPAGFVWQPSTICSGTIVVLPIRSNSHGLSASIAGWFQYYSAVDTVHHTEQDTL